MQRARLVLLFVLTAGSALVGVGMGTWGVVPVVAVFAGGLGGGLWLLAANIAWWRLVPISVRERLNVRGLVPLAQRRLLGGVAVVLWLLFLAVVGRTVTAEEGYASFVVLLGALNVVVLVTLAHVMVADELEREEWSAQQEMLWRQRAYAKAVKKGLVPPPGSQSGDGVNPNDPGVEGYGDEEWEYPEASFDESTEPVRKKSRRWGWGK